MNVWRTLDLLAILDVSGQGVVYKLYEKAVKKQGGYLSKLATELVLETIEGGNIAIVTGFLIPPSYSPETDGPLSALIFSYTLHGFFNTNFTIVTERRVADFVPSCVLMGVSLTSVKGRGSFEEFSRILSRNDIDLIIFVEKPGVDRKGKMFTFKGIDVTDIHMDTEAFVQAAKSLGVPTLGVGDRGNEVGMGIIAEEFSGNLCAVKTDVLHIGCTSNDALFSVEAGVSLAKKVDIYHSWSLEKHLLKALIDSGFIDGVTGEQSYSVDSIPVDILECKNRMFKFFTRNLVKPSSTQSYPSYPLA